MFLYVKNKTKQFNWKTNYMHLQYSEPLVESPMVLTLKVHILGTRKG